MFTFLVQLIDLLQFGEVQFFFVFFILTWSIYFIKLLRSFKFRPPVTEPNDFGVSIIVPVVDEEPEMWAKVLARLQESCAGIKHQIIVVSNGPAGKANREYAQSQGLKVIHLPEADKRAAVAEGAYRACHEISVILDSDTQVLPDSIRLLRDTFTSKDIGGVTPLQKIIDREPWIRRVSDWLEDLRFNIGVKGQSVSGAVACLPGRLFAIRTDLLKAAMPDFLNEYFFGIQCLTGDDRSLTSWLLKSGYKTIYQPESVVFTEAPSSASQFIKQRLRWARSTTRAAIIDAKWLLRYPFTAFTVFTEILLRWALLAVLVHATLTVAGVLPQDHYVWKAFPQYRNLWVILVGVVCGFILGELFKQLIHLIYYPQDIIYFPILLFIATFVLIPVGFLGDLTCWRNDWMTRSITIPADFGLDRGIPTKQLLRMGNGE